MGEEKAVEAMSKVCQEAGICQSVQKVEAEKAVELYKPDKPDKILITLWKDGRTTACYKKDADIQCCYTTSEPTPELYYIWQAFFTSPEEKFGYRVRELHGEAETKPLGAPRAEIRERIVAGADVR